MSLKIENLNKEFMKGRNILENVNLEIQNGEFICLLGSSGCGKSTFLNMVAGLDTPTGGRITLDGEEITAPGRDRSYIFQEPALFPWLNVVENVKFGMKMNNISKNEQKEKAVYYLDMVKLRDYCDYRIHQLSGGMKQRVSLARALTMDSKVLLMDEPFAALDAHTKTEMRAHLVDIWNKTKKTIIFVTHSIEEAFILADRVIVFSKAPATIVQEFNPKGKSSEEISEMAKKAECLLAEGVQKIAV